MIHETPTQEIFNEIKNAALKIWNTYDNSYGYVSEKTQMVNEVEENIQDNVMIFYRMFDGTNKRKMESMLSSEALEYIRNNK